MYLDHASALLLSYCAVTGTCKTFWACPLIASCTAVQSMGWLPPLNSVHSLAGETVVQECPTICKKTLLRHTR
jgi:hypothetical protein